MTSRIFRRTVAIGVGVAALSFGGTSMLTQARSLQQAGQHRREQTASNHRGSAEGNRRGPRTAQKIRKSIVGDKSLSTYGHNVKVIVRSGVVTLKGPVQSEDEKKNIGAKAADVAGADKVQNELTVKS
jgi:Predicted periplasmic or secreted lipoprotein